MLNNSTNTPVSSSTFPRSQATTRAERPGAERRAPAAADQAVEPGVLPHLTDFFDADHNGKISIPETIEGLRRLGIGRLAATAIGVTINFGLGGFMPSNPFALNVSKMHKAKHPSDTDIINEKGGFSRQRFEEVFRKYGGPNGDSLTGPALVRLWLDNVLRDLGPASVLGATAAVGEFGLLYYLGRQPSDRGPVLTKQRVQDFYLRPELFDEIAEEQERARGERDKTVPGKLMNVLHKWIF